jgi:hypothetical protein
MPLVATHRDTVEITRGGGNTVSGDTDPRRTNRRRAVARSPADVLFFAANNHCSPACGFSPRQSPGAAATDDVARRVAANRAAVTSAPLHHLDRRRARRAHHPPIVSTQASSPRPCRAAEKRASGSVCPIPTHPASLSASLFNGGVTMAPTRRRARSGGAPHATRTARPTSAHTWPRPTCSMSMWPDRSGRQCRAVRLPRRHVDRPNRRGTGDANCRPSARRCR